MIYINYHLLIRVKETNWKEKQKLTTELLLQKSKNQKKIIMAQVYQKMFACKNCGSFHTNPKFVSCIHQCTGRSVGVAWVWNGPSKMIIFNDGYRIYNNIPNYIKIQAERAILPNKYSLPQRFFKDWRNLQRVVLPEMEGIGREIFHVCINLIEVVIHPNTKIIWAHAFQGCRKLKELTLPKEIKVICMGAFMNSGLEKIIFPEGLNTIKKNAFMNTNLKEIVFPKSLSNIDDRAFCGCKQLEKVTFTSDGSFLKFGDRIFYDCS